MTQVAQSPAAAARVAVDSQLAESELRFVGLVTRAIAFSIDAALVNLIAIVVAAAIGLILSVLSVPDWLDKALVAVGGAVFLGWAAGYFVIFWCTTGQTPGARIMRMRVCRADTGALLGPSRAVLRLIFLTLAAVPLLAGFLPILVDLRRRGLHDMLAGTVVVEAPDVPARRGAGA